MQTSNQKIWKSVFRPKGTLSKKNSLSQINRKKPSIPGSKGGGNYYHIIVRPKDDFISFRYHDVGRPGHIQRLAGRSASGIWETQAWLISKNDAHVEEEHLVPDTYDAAKLLRSLGTVPQYIKGDLFEAKEKKAVSVMQKTADEEKEKDMQVTWWLN